jgi:hypothetical protein
VRIRLRRFASRTSTEQPDQTQITQTLRRLRDRIAERFPESGIANVGAELVSLSDQAFACVAYVRRPNWRTALPSTR